MRLGPVAGIAAFAMWGALPVFWKALDFLPPTAIIAQRTLWSLAALVPLVAASGRGPQLAAALRSPRPLCWLALSAALLGGNWLIYVWATLNGHIIESALGYYLTPFLNMLAGRWLFGDRHNRLQLVAIATAAAGVALRFHAVRGVPWVALGLAGTFALYGLARKQSPLDTPTGLAGETLVLALPALAWLALSLPSPAAAFGGSPARALLVAAAGPLTVAPLLCFGHAARTLRLSTLGILQFLAPTLQFLIGWLLYHEPLDRAGLASFTLIWLAVALYARGARARGHRPPPGGPPPGP